MKNNINIIKRILTGIGAGMFITAALLGCKDKLDDYYVNPEGTSEASIGNFFTQMLDDNRVRPAYWNVRTFLVMHPAVYTQAVSYINTTQRYLQQASYLQNYWDDFYVQSGNGSGIVSHMREMEKTYATLSDEDKETADLVMYAARVIYYDRTSQMVDLWGDIPWSEAGSLNLTGTASNAKFDDAEEVYTAILAGLEEASDYFSSESITEAAKAALSAQDILLAGDLDAWKRYTNSLRLRLLMRISYQNESKAQTDIMEMLNDPDTYPLVDDAEYNVLLDPLTTYTDKMYSALTELDSHIATEFLLDDMLKPVNDPRIRVMYDKNRRKSGSTYTANEDYFSMPDGIASSTQISNIGNGMYATLDSATFLYNTAFPGVVITSAEVNFIKAEAYERWGSSSDAQTAYEAGVTDAVEFLFYLNELGVTSSGHEAADALTTDEMTDLLAQESVAYSGTSDEKLVKIWTQKWLSFGFIQSIQGWAELRRTKYPVLTFIEDSSTSGYELPPNRLLYPSDEKTYNADNYAEVSADDNAATKIFWDVK